MNKAKTPKFESSSRILSPRDSFRDENYHIEILLKVNIEKALETTLVRDLDRLVKMLKKKDFS